MVQDAHGLTPEQVFDQHLASFSDALLMNQQWDRLLKSIDFAVYARAFTLYDPKMQARLSQRALARMQPISMVLGWGDEFDMVSAASRHGHQVLCSDYSLNLPVHMNFGPPDGLQRDHPQATCSPGPPDVHTVAFMFTDGDSISWNLGEFLSPENDWWASPSRGQVPIAWTFQPLLQELHPHYLSWMHGNRCGMP